MSGFKLLDTSASEFYKPIQLCMAHLPAGFTNFAVAEVSVGMDGMGLLKTGNRITRVSCKMVSVQRHQIPITKIWVFNRTD